MANRPLPYNTIGMRQQAHGYSGYQGYGAGANAGPKPVQSVSEILSQSLGEVPPDLAGAQGGASRQREIADMLMQGVQQQDNTSIAGGLSQLGQAFLARGARKKADAAEDKYGAMVQALTQKAVGGDEASIAALLSPEAAIQRGDQNKRYSVEDAMAEKQFGLQERGVNLDERGLEYNMMDGDRQFGLSRDTFEEGKRQFGLGYDLDAELGRGSLGVQRGQLALGRDELAAKIAADEAEKTAAMQPVPGLPPPTTSTAGLPAGVIGTYARSDEKALDAAREAAGKSRERSTLTSQFVDKAEGFGAQGKGFFNDIGQMLSMKTSGLEQITSKLGPSSRPEGSGSTSDKDMAVYMQSTVNVDNTKGTNKDIAAMEAAMANRDAAYLQWLQDYTAAYPTPGATRDAKRLWDQYSYADENSLFSVDQSGRVAVKQPKPIMEWLASQQGAAPDVGTGTVLAETTEFDDDASIPEGAVVEDETGKRFRKQNGQLVPVGR